ncbi:hypothetical protein IU459_35530 [Nocardia amamiensis]|uniref:Secreted protein n=1 Tax=Nocardia amamiensis TaxID=404578 RepID=A0ABS0D492_9NOCA|nr:hypothetical protein [Nocardia amamiensis]MBF6302807.1 hypothetical protein [Nocardia amamiensis]
MKRFTTCLVLATALLAPGQLMMVPAATAAPTAVAPVNGPMLGSADKGCAPPQLPCSPLMQLFIALTTGSAEASGSTKGGQ